VSLAANRRGCRLCAAGLDGDLLIWGRRRQYGASLARLATRPALQAGRETRVIAVARFFRRDLREHLEAGGIDTIACDLLETGLLARLP